MRARAFRRVPDDTQQTVLHHLHQGMSQAEVAALLGLSKSTVGDIARRVGYTPPPRRARVGGGMTRDELVAEVEHLWGTDDPGNIARRLGYKTPEGLAKRLTAAGREDLARPFHAVNSKQRRQAA